MTPYDANARCPKCGFGAVTSEYHKAFHSDCSASPISMSTYLWQLDMWMFLAPLGSESGEAPKAPSVPPHIERKCVNCKHAWPEEPLS